MSVWKEGVAWKMEIEIVRERDNKLLRRKEILFKVKHGSSGEVGSEGSSSQEHARGVGSGTPSRKEVREALVRKFGCRPQVLVIDWMKPAFGKTEALGYAKIYESEARMREIEREHILRRNFPEAPEGEAATA